LSESPKLVRPGEPLAVLEEFEPGPGAYVDNKGIVRAAVTGIVEYDKIMRIVRVNPLRHPKMPRVGSEVVALVTSVRSDVVFIEILGEVSLKGVPRFLYEYSSTYAGAIAIGNISEEYVNDINDYYRVSDIILAKVISSIPPFHAETKEPMYGVIYARCARCGRLLEPVNNRTMRCPYCGHVEKRKVSALASSKLLRINLRHLLVKTLA
jgi:exosome complex component CSL4